MSNTDDGRGAPAAAEQRTIVHARSRQGHMIPGGSLEAARTAIGMNAVDRDMLPSYGVADQTWVSDTPER